MNTSLIAFGWVFAASAILSACQEQTSKKGEIPSAVQIAFQEKFPQSSDVTWEKESDQELEAAFTLNGEKMSANFSQDGTWLETESEIKEHELPEAV